MAAFQQFGIPVTLASSGTTILMTTIEGYDPDNHMVVFADPQKLRPYMEAINAGEDSSYLARKHADAQKGIQAAKTELTDPKPVITPDENPLPMAKVNWAAYDPKNPIKFTDGVTRTTELVRQRAEYIPVEVLKSEAWAVHGAIGSDRFPESARLYAVPEELSRERMLAWYRHPSRKAMLE